MLVSHLTATQKAGSEQFGTDFPSIFQIQDLIENAWDMGINPQGRVETGGIKGSRKYIGTPEVGCADQSAVPVATSCSLQVGSSIVSQLKYPVSRLFSACMPLSLTMTQVLGAGV